MKTKKIPFYLLLFLLTIGASLILGFLSFAGMFVLWPILPLALGSFVLSVAYEGEIYLQNIKGALNKLFFKREYLKHYLAKEFLKTQFPDVEEADCPQFFKDYLKQLELLHQFGHKRLDKASLARKKKIEKTLRDMNKWFALHLFADKDESRLTDYERELRTWLANNQQGEWQAKLQKHRLGFHAVKAFSVLAATFMGLGTTYLLLETFAAIPLLAAIPFALLPAFIVPMAIIAGAAYGFLTYNAITDMINNNTLGRWYNKLRESLTQKPTLRSVLFTATALLLVALAVALTVCTAGTWWTIAKHTKPLFSWMSKIPGFITGGITLFTGTSALAFNLQNTSESLEMVEQATESKPLEVVKKNTQVKPGVFERLREKENWLQIINPARLLLKLTFMPLRILLFLGHLISIGVTADRVPGIPEILSALLGIISEGFEDMHYFFGHKHHHEHGHDKQSPDSVEERKQHRQHLLNEHLSSEHGHDHSADIPTRLLKVIFSPLFALAAFWDSQASRLNKDSSRKVLDFSQAWGKQTGQKKIKTVKPTGELPSDEWKIEHTIYRIDRIKKKHLQQAVLGKPLARNKAEALTSFQEKLRRKEIDSTIENAVKKEAEQPIYGAQRFFNPERLLNPEAKTHTQNSLGELSSQISPAA
ncbi:MULTISPECIES: hypothetical protein [unclassified Legionella]|uniref:hypothetical protein n=1 Tax=unclassified Legionella TaxID=2622702 RepID=UPI001054269F|nr:MULTISPECIES: hypothetical protein [unclassified Legionella]MDI9819054.1 hypothetical protein [Legionella sp. PL877]